MNTKMHQLHYLLPLSLGLLSACSSGDINFPDVNPINRSGLPGTIQFAEISYDVSEGEMLNIRVARSGGSSGTVSVDYACADGTAVDGSDYTGTSGRLTWGNGVSGNRTISIPITDDDTAEATESFTVTLSGVSAAILGENSSATVNIVDNDVAAVKASGSVTALNGLTIDGIHYNTNTAIVSIDGLPATASDLKLGQFVVLEGDVNFSDATGTAAAISYFASIIGPVESVDVSEQRMSILGQTVLTSADTVFAPGIDRDTFAGLGIGATAEISGYRNTDGELVATRVEHDMTSTGVQLIGTVTGLDLARMVFAVNDLAVDYGNAALIDLEKGMPENGLPVMIRGSLSDGVLIVDEIAGVMIEE